MVKATLTILLAIHALLAAWALLGLIEFFWPAPPWDRISNPLFPRPILLLQWLLTLTAAVVFIGGHVRRCSGTAISMMVVYGAMASLCALQTFVYMTSDTRFIAMAMEYLAYAGILCFLFRTQSFRAR